MYKRLRAGDKVKIVNCTREELAEYGSSGVMGGEYLIERVSSGGQDVCFVGGNWHKKRWLVKVFSIRRGGE